MIKDEMKPTGRPSDAPPPENEDIAKLLRALNEDLRAEPMDDEADEVDDEPAARSLPLGKIALAMLAAAGIGAAVVMLDPGGKAPDPATTAAGNATPMVPAPAITRAPAANGTPEPMIARAPAASTAPAAPQAATPAAPAATGQGATGQTASAAPPPPMAALPANPPPVLKVPEPPAVPATAPVAPAKPRAAIPAEPAPQAAPPAPAKAEPPKPEPTRPEPAAKDTAESADSGSLQAMLAPPKGDAKRATPNAAPAAPATAAPPAGAAKAPVAKAPVPTAQPPAGRYTVQVGSFQMTANADSLLQKLQSNGFQAYTVDWTDSANKSWRAVRVGGYSDPAAAKREAEQLKTKMGLNPVVVTAR